MKIIIFNFIIVYITTIRQNENFLMNGEKPNKIGEEFQKISKESLDYKNNKQNYYYLEENDHVVIQYK
jgi:hypothetical protein